MRIKDLATRATKLLTGNAWFVVDNGTKVEKAAYSEVVKQGIEEYAGSTLAGSAQTVKSAIDALNSNIINTPITNTVRYSGDNTVFDVPHTSASDVMYYKTGVAFSSGHPTLGGSSGILFGYRINTGYGWQEFWSSSSHATRELTNNTWSDWKLVPTRAEIDAVIKRGDYKSILDNRFDAHDTQPGSYWVARAANIPDSHQYGFLTHEVSSADTQERLLTFHPYNSPEVFYKATSNDAGSTWTAWYKYTGTQVS